MPKAAGGSCAGGVVARVRRRAGLTLLELMMTVAIAGILIGVAAVRLTPSAQRNFGSRSAARQLAVDCWRAQRSAIATGENHYLQFAPSGGPVEGYEIYRRTSGGSVLVAPMATIPDGVTTTVSHSTAEFTFEGSALAAYEITLSGPGHAWRVQVTPVTGTAHVEQIP